MKIRMLGRAILLGLTFCAVELPAQAGPPGHWPSTSAAPRAAVARPAASARPGVAATPERSNTPDAHYELRRDVFRVTLEGTPAARVSCTVTDRESGATSTVVWDPSDNGTVTRYALLPRFAPTSPAPRVRELSCRAATETVKNAGGADAVVLYTVQASVLPAPVLLTGHSVAAGATQRVSAIDLAIKAEQVTGKELERVLAQRNGDVQTTRLRSLDPTTALINDALTAIATVALDRAKSSGKEYARKLLQEQLCDVLTVGAIREQLVGTALADALNKLNWPNDRRLLHSTCALVETLRLDELVSARDAVWKAVGTDASELAAEFLKSTLSELGEERVGELLQATSALITSALTRSTTTERDAQVLLLALGRIGLSTTGASGAVNTGDWQWSMELGITVLQECLRTSECPADELQRLLEQEIELNSVLPQTVLGSWPELPAVLGRAANVLRPPAGTPAGTTAANAVALMLDVVEHALGEGSLKKVCVKNTQQPPLVESAKQASGTNSQDSCAGLEGTWTFRDLTDVELKEADELNVPVAVATAQSREDALALVRTLRGIIAGLQGEDITPAIVELQRVFELAIVTKCEKRVICKVPFTQRQLRRGFKVLAAVAAYGASYRKADGDGAADLEKHRAEERSRAVESLIDAVTDRSDRHREWVVALGANVALGADRRLNPRRFPDYTNRLPLSLKTGLAVQYLPGDRFWSAGFHGMLTAIDLAQYATLGGSANGDSEDVPEPELTSALRLGGEAGFLFGEPSFPITLTAQFGWVPRVNYDAGSRSEWSVGAGVGIFVPFVDFN